MPDVAYHQAVVAEHRCARNHTQFAGSVAESRDTVAESSFRVDNHDVSLSSVNQNQIPCIVEVHLGDFRECLPLFWRNTAKSEDFLRRCDQRHVRSA